MLDYDRFSRDDPIGYICYLLFGRGGDGGGSGDGEKGRGCGDGGNYGVSSLRLPFYLFYITLVTDGGNYGYNYYRY